MNTSLVRILPLALAVAVSLSACKQGAEVDSPQAATPVESAAPAQPEAAPVAVQSGTYQLDPAHTNVLASWTHFGFSKPHANFGDAKGTLVFDADNPANSSVEVTLPPAGLNGFSDRFNDHLRSPDFFDAARFPEAKFKSTAVEPAGVNAFKVTGDLTVKDQTRPVTLDVTLNGAGEHPMRKVQTVGFNATATLKRSDFGVGAFAPNVSDEVSLVITTEASVAPPADAPAK